MKEYVKEDSCVRLFSICQPEYIGCYVHVCPLVYSRDGRRILLDLDALRFGWYDWSQIVWQMGCLLDMQAVVFLFRFKIGCLLKIKPCKKRTKRSNFFFQSSWLTFISRNTNTYVLLIMCIFMWRAWFMSKAHSDFVVLRFTCLRWKTIK